MGATQIKEELFNFIEAGDPKLIKMLHAVAKEYSSEEYDLNEPQLTELDKRIQKYEAGRMVFSSWDDVKARIKDRTSDAL
jgi:putative addiction module component (TIGR02574 family)